MPRSQRILLIALAVAVAVVAAVISSSDGGDGPATTGAAGATDATVPRTSTAPQEARPKPRRPPAAVVRIEGGAPRGGVTRIRVKTGDTVRLVVRSRDTSDHVHVHGYDLVKDLRPGASARFTFRAELEGIYEVELEEAGVQIARIEVRPS